MATKQLPPAKRKRYALLSEVRHSGLTCARLDFSEDIVALVGSNEERFTLHKGIITNHSKFFKAACSGNFSEAKDKIIRLPEIDVDNFVTYLQWVYTGTIITGDEENADKSDYPKKSFYSYIKLYVLADQLDDMRLRNAIMDVLTALSKVPAVTDAFVLGYNSTPESSILRKFIRRAFRVVASDKRALLKRWVRERSSKLPHDLLVDLACDFIDLAKDTMEGHEEEGICSYHEHNEEVPKCVQSNSP